MRNANAMQLLRHCEPFLEPKLKICINGDSFWRMVDMVERRPLKLHLRIILRSHHFTADIPAELAEMHKDLLTLIIEK